MLLLALRLSAWRLTMIDGLDDAAQSGKVMTMPSNVNSWHVPVMFRCEPHLASSGHAPAGLSGLGARMSAWCFNLAFRWTCVFRFVLHVIANDEPHDRTAPPREK